jgi:hypothetical protein
MRPDIFIDHFVASSFASWRKPGGRFAVAKGTLTKAGSKIYGNIKWD